MILAISGHTHLRNKAILSVFANLLIRWWQCLLFCLCVMLTQHINDYNFDFKHVKKRNTLLICNNTSKTNRKPEAWKVLWFAYGGKRFFPNIHLIYCIEPGSKLINHDLKPPVGLLFILILKCFGNNSKTLAVYVHISALGTSGYALYCKVLLASRAPKWFVLLQIKFKIKPL